MDDNENGTESAEVALTRVSRELQVAREQRTALAQAAQGWVGRFYGLKVSNGDLVPQALGYMIEREVRELDAICNQVAEQVEARYTT